MNPESNQSVQEPHASNSTSHPQGELAAVLESMTDGVNVYDSNGHILYMNSAYRKLIGLDTLPSHLQLTPAERAQQLQLRDENGKPLRPEQQPVQRMIAGAVLSSENMMDIIVRSLDGRELQLNITGAPTYDNEGRIQGGVLIFRDVTERRRLERRTQESLEALLMMAEELVQRSEKPLNDVENMPDKVVAHRLAELIRSVLASERVSITLLDPVTHEMRSSAVVGLSPELEQLWYERRSGFLLSEQVKMPSLDEQLHENEVLVIDMTKPPLSERPNPYDIRTMLLAPMILGSSLVGVLAIDNASKPYTYTRDDIALTKAVAKLAALVVERERLIQERAETQASVLALHEANRRMDEFLGIASHEIKTPLTAIKANIQLVQRQVKRLAKEMPLTGEDLLPRLEPIQKMLERAARQVEVQNRLVSDLLDVSRIYADKLELRIELCDLAAIVQRTVDDQMHVVAPRIIHLEMVAKAVPIMADADRVEQVLNNYLSNALKYSESQYPVWVSLKIMQDMVSVLVRDKGPGLTVEQQEHVWERFYRAKGVEVLTGSGVGLGLGLHICRTIIERQGGQVGVDSTPGDGSVFWFSLPIYRI